MADEIDEDDVGAYTEGTVLGYASRKEAAENQIYTISSVNVTDWDVQRVGGVLHRVQVYRFGDMLVAGCDCYDFSTYGTGYKRACQHIWAVILTQDIPGG